MQLMLPLVIRADTGFYGAEDLATRLAKDDTHLKKTNFKGRSSMPSWKLTFIPSSGGGLLVKVLLVVSFSYL